MTLEAIVIEDGKVFESLPAASKAELTKGSSKTFFLWTKSARWLAPSPQTELMTTPGINMRNAGVPPTDYILRFVLYWIIELTRRGGHIESSLDWTTYIGNPFSVKAPFTVPFGFVIHSSDSPSFVKPAGEKMSVSLNNQSRGADLITIRSVKRAGLVIDLKRRQASSGRGMSKRQRVSLPTESAVTKYNPIPHPLLRLHRQALPPQASEEDYERAAANFSCSITHRTQSGYATTARHLAAAELSLGHSFSNPPTPEEQLFFLNYLQGKGLKPDTVRNYMSAFKFVVMSRGATEPGKLSSLASQLLVGGSNREKDALKEATKKSKRAITIDMLKLIKISISRRQDWSTFEQSLHFSVSLLAWWGSFRPRFKPANFSGR